MDPYVLHQESTLLKHEVNTHDLAHLIQKCMWVEFVGSHLCAERFSPGSPVSPLLKRPPFDLICVNY